MKNSRLVLAALAVAAAGSWSVYAVACDKNKSQTSAANATTASAPAKYGSCSAKTTSATTASTASSSGCSAHTMDASTAASHEGCGGSASGASAVTASTAGAKTMKMAGADGCCSAKSAKSAKSAMASNGEACGGSMAGISSCSGQALTMAMCKESHAGCDACEDMGTFDTELSTASAAVQVVPIKNGVMFVYTAAVPGKVNALQSAVTRRSEQLQKIVAAGDKAHLCDGCKTMRGAMASGKVTREVVNIEGGALTLVTSNDPTMVKQIRAMADANKTAARVKS